MNHQGSSTSGPASSSHPASGQDLLSGIQDLVTAPSQSSTDSAPSEITTPLPPPSASSSTELDNQRSTLASGFQELEHHARESEAHARRMEYHAKEMEKNSKLAEVHAKQAEMHAKEMEVNSKLMQAHAEKANMLAQRFEAEAKQVAAGAEGAATGV